MNCPLCVQRRLEPVIVDGVEIDVCENCGGVWLDRGELERMARPGPSQAAPTSTEPSSPKPAKGSKSSGAKKPKKQKSLGARLGDLLEEALDL